MVDIPYDIKTNPAVSSRSAGSVEIKYYTVGEITAGTCICPLVFRYHVL